MKWIRESAKTERPGRWRGFGDHKRAKKQIQMIAYQKSDKRKTCLKAYIAAILNASSLESTVWAAPSVKTIRIFSTGWPIREPLHMRAYSDIMDAEHKRINIHGYVTNQRYNQQTHVS